ncbi:MAG: NAD-dependent epimerase/dehydratase family protein [Actinomycetota bacterium]
MTGVLVTGGAGFIGSNLCDRLLAEGHEVVAVDDLSTGRIANLAEARGAGSGFSFQNLDVRSEALLPLFEHHRPEVVMHLAARPGAESMQDPLGDASVALMGLLNVLQCSVAVDVTKVVFASSASAIYGDLNKKLPAKESAAPGARPLSPHGVGKKLAEDYLRFYKHAHGIEFVSLALGTVYGPRQVPPGVVASLAGSLVAGTAPTIHGDGDQTRDMVFVDDAVHALALALERGKGKLVNVGTGVETSINDLYASLVQITGVEVVPESDDRPAGESRRMVLDISLAEKDLGWKPWTHLEDGLRETVAYLRGV